MNGKYNGSIGCEPLGVVIQKVGQTVIIVIRRKTRISDVGWLQVRVNLFAAEGKRLGRFARSAKIGKPAFRLNFCQAGDDSRLKDALMVRVPAQQRETWP